MVASDAEERGVARHDWGAGTGGWAVPASRPGGAEGHLAGPGRRGAVTGGKAVS
jgi:hypothetical protein